jgi:tetratricopeptide (TPR) repeat protein
MTSAFHFKPLLLGLALAAVLPAQTTAYQPGDFQQTNPNYPLPNPFYFEGKIDWEKLAIAQPSNAWEYAQHGMHLQDDLEDIPGAIADYEKSLSMNSLANGTCQIVTQATLVDGQLPSRLDPPPCMFTVRLRLAYLLRQQDPATAIALFQEVLTIDPLRLGVNAMIGETYMIEAGQAPNDADRRQAWQQAVTAFQAELALSPVTPATMALTHDMANNAHVHWNLAQVYENLGRTTDQMKELQAYLQATQWHSDVYPWRIAVARKKLEQMAGPQSNRRARTM